MPELNQALEDSIKEVKSLADKDNVHITFSKNDARLFISEWGEYARIQSGNMSYYFHKSKDKEVIHTTYATMGDDKKKLTIVPYDGYECGWQMILPTT